VGVPVYPLLYSFARLVQPVAEWFPIVLLNRTIDCKSVTGWTTRVIHILQFCHTQPAFFLLGNRLQYFADSESRAFSLYKSSCNSVPFGLSLGMLNG